MELKVAQTESELQIEYSLRNSYQAIAVQNRQARQRSSDLERDPHWHSLHLLHGDAPLLAVPAIFSVSPHYDAIDRIVLDADALRSFALAPTSARLAHKAVVFRPLAAPRC